MKADVPKIRMRGVRKAFGTKQVLDGVDLDVASGHGMVILGGLGSIWGALMGGLSLWIVPECRNVAMARLSLSASPGVKPAATMAICIACSWNSGMPKVRFSTS